jgi:phenylpropionate dioxygenase-like ring-hydroxylating dioxygenase large terminal subunit
MAGTDFKQRVEDRLEQGLLGQWYVIAKSADVLVGWPTAAQALGRKLVIWRTEDGLKCLEDYCPHRGARLSRGEILGGNIACRYHGLVIDGDGRILQVPAMPDCSLEGRKAVTSYAVREAHDAIFAYFPSAEQPEPHGFDLPTELEDPEYTHFLATAPWNCNYRYALDNLADPMHGCYLHANTFTLAYGTKQDLMEIGTTDDGFLIARVGQRGENFDWTDVVAEKAVNYCRVDIPYPTAGGPGGVMRILAFVTPIDEENCRIFFWRTRKVSGLAREVWRFMYRTRFEARHWFVLEQDREMLAAMPADARRREMLYQHDIGVSRLRKILVGRAKAQIEHEDRLYTQATS